MCFISVNAVSHFTISTAPKQNIHKCESSVNFHFHSKLDGCEEDDIEIRYVYLCRVARQSVSSAYLNQAEGFSVLDAIA